MYFVCSKSKPCKFFQWSDEIEQENNKSSSQSKVATAASTCSWGSSNRTANSAGSSGSWDSSNRNTNITSTSSSWGSRDSDLPASRELINCNCNKPANNLTVRKDGPNKGRDFYACANREKSCGFFQWADETENDQISNRRSNTFSASSSNRSFNNRPNTSTNASSWGYRDMDLPGDSREPVNCNCNSPANSLTVRKDGPNKGRGFYACANRDKSCGFFQWADQNENQGKVAKKF